MHRLPGSPFLYPILDSRFSKDIVADAKAVIRAGARIFQLRAKDWSKRKIFETVEKLVLVCREQNVCMIVNDFVDITLLSAADGVHLGQSDFPVLDARKLLPYKIIGASTHNLEQLQVANGLPVDYIAIGPMYRSSTKPEAGSPVGIAFLQQVRNLTERPLVCIGGIGSDNFADLIRAGADGIAVLSTFYKEGDIFLSISRLIETLNSVPTRKR